MGTLSHWATESIRNESKTLEVQKNLRKQLVRVIKTLSLTLKPRCILVAPPLW